jgi:hypothetical protein
MDNEQQSLKEAYKTMLLSAQEEKGGPLSDEEKDRIVFKLYHELHGIHLSDSEMTKLRQKLEKAQSKE